MGLPADTAKKSLDSTDLDESLLAFFHVDPAQLGIYILPPAIVRRVGVNCAFQRNRSIQAGYLSSPSPGRTGSTTLAMHIVHLDR
jgi:hypothetical protein